MVRLGLRRLVRVVRVVVLGTMMVLVTVIAEPIVVVISGT